MEKEILEKWRKIYNFAHLIAAYDPWELFAEENTFALVPKGTRNEHYFSFLAESAGQCGIAIYPGGNAYVAAQCRLHGGNPKREPRFDLQDAVVLLWGDREDVSKENYEFCHQPNPNLFTKVCNDPFNFRIANFNYRRLRIIPGDMADHVKQGSTGIIRRREHLRV